MPSGIFSKIVAFISKDERTAVSSASVLFNIATHQEDLMRIDHYALSEEELVSVAKTSLRLLRQHIIPRENMLGDILMEKVNPGKKYLYFMQIIQLEKMAVIDDFFRLFPPVETPSRYLELLSHEERIKTLKKSYHVSTLTDQMNSLLTRLKNLDGYEHPFQDYLAIYVDKIKEKKDLETCRKLNHLIKLSENENGEDELPDFLTHSIFNSDTAYSPDWVAEFCKIISTFRFSTSEKKYTQLYQVMIDYAIDHNTTQFLTEVLKYETDDQLVFKVAKIVLDEYIDALLDRTHYGINTVSFQSFISEINRLNLSDQMKQKLFNRITKLDEFSPTYEQELTPFLFQLFSFLPNQFIESKKYAGVFNKLIEAAQRHQRIDFCFDYSHFFSLFQHIDNDHDPDDRLRMQILDFLLKSMHQLALNLNKPFHGRSAALALHKKMTRLFLTMRKNENLIGSDVLRRSDEIKAAVLQFPTILSIALEKESSYALAIHYLLFFNDFTPALKECTPAILMNSLFLKLCFDCGETYASADDVILNAMPRLSAPIFSIALSDQCKATMSGVNIVILAGAMGVAGPNYLRPYLMGFLDKFILSLQAFSTDETKKSSSKEGLFSLRLDLVKELNDYLKSEKSSRLRHFLYRQGFIESFDFNLDGRVERLIAGNQHGTPH